MKNYGLLLLVSAIWGSSYIFMKILAPVYGALFVAFSRIFIGGVIVTIYCLIKGIKFDFKKNFKHYLIVGLIGCGLPFVFFSYAALYINASLSVIINALTPIFVSMYGIYFLKEKLKIIQVIGLVLAFMGVVYISLSNSSSSVSTSVYGVILVVLATQCYALNNIYATLKTRHINPVALSAGSLIFTALLLMPVALLTVKTTRVDFVFEFLFLGLVCTGIAYMIYYYLVSQITTRALQTTFLQPLFGVLWSYLFLGEDITVKLIIGMIVTIVGVYMFLSVKIKR